MTPQQATGILLAPGFTAPYRRGFINITILSRSHGAVTKGRLDFGLWEQIFYGEFDGRRKKRVLVKIIGE